MSAMDDVNVASPGGLAHLLGGYVFRRPRQGYVARGGAWKRWKRGTVSAVNSASFCNVGPPFDTLW